MNLLIPVCVFLPMLAAVLVYIICKRSFSAANTFACCFTAVIFVCTILLALFGENSSFVLSDFCMMGISFSFSGFKAILAILCAFGFMLSIFSSHSYFSGSANNARYFAFTLFTFGATMGVFLSDDLFTTYIFFEMMSLASWVWVAQTETVSAAQVSRAYLAYSIIGGLALLMGLVLINTALDGVLSFDQIASAAAQTSQKELLFAGGIFLFAGFGIKAGAFPLHTWLPNAHPIAPAPASALLSGILTKAGVFGLIIGATRIFYQNTTYAMILLVSGTITMLLGALTALFAINLKRALAGSSLSQIGFILVGLSMLTFGKDTAYAAGGVILHIINHALIKLVLFISAGAFYKNYHTIDLNKLRGTGRSNSLLAVCFTVAAAAISGIPMLSGYISKTLIHEAIVENIHIASASMHDILSVVEILFIIAGGFTLAYMCKLIYKLFIQKPLSAQSKPLKLDCGTSLAITLPAVLLILCGILPNLTYEKLAVFASQSLNAEAFSAHYFSLTNLQGALYSILIGIVLFILVRLLLIDKKGDLKTFTFPISLEKHIYSSVINALSFLGALIARVFYSTIDFLIHIISLIVFFHDPYRVPAMTDDHFGRYTKKYVRAGRIDQTLAFELLLFGIGVAIVLIYLVVI
ncbi:MAG: sodium:proton antiporter [Clostridia bacterium]|nr:sodium:proton antiporter [Clostridia bacterium]